MNIKLHEIIESEDLPVIYYYIALFVRTIIIIIKENPKYIFVMNPSSLCALFIVLFGKIFNKVIIVDAHNAGVHFENANPLVRGVLQIFNIIIMRFSKIIIVTNDRLAKYVKQKNGTPFILPDPFPKFKNFEKLKLKGQKNIFYICTYAGDEPYLNVIESAAFLDPDVFIYISGRKKKMSLNLPANIMQTDYLPEQEFINYLFSADVVMDLTLREDCLLCGAYETIAVEKPLILSRTKALQDYFSEAAIFTDNSPSDIAVKIKKALENESILIKKLKAFKDRQSIQITEQLITLNKIIEIL